jgi:hypothetical protein
MSSKLNQIIFKHAERSYFRGLAKFILIFSLSFQYVLISLFAINLSYILVFLVDVFLHINKTTFT